MKVVRIGESPLRSAPKFIRGESDFKKYSQSEAVYVDKTRFISDWWKSGDKISLLVRPRRFSKTTAMSTVYSWFCAEDRDSIFAGTEILESWCDWDIFTENRLDCIFLTFKNIRGKDYNSLFNSLKSIIFESMGGYIEYVKEYEDSYFTEVPKKYEIPQSVKDLLSFYPDFLRFLSKKLGKTFIILLDEYDKILLDAHEVGGAYFEEVLEEYRYFLTAMFKDTSFVEKAILTGVLPLAANSSLSAFNNAVVDSFLDKKYEGIFGFTEEEVKVLVDGWMSQNDKKRMVDLLEGYSSGDIRVYNPWSVINYIDSVANKTVNISSSNWVSTGSNDWIFEVGKLDADDYGIIVKLLGGSHYTLRLNNSISYYDRSDNLDNLMTYAFYAGYLTFLHVDNGNVGLEIPNTEVQEAWIVGLSRLSNISKSEYDWDRLLDSLSADSASELRISEVMGDILERHVSVYDLVSENSYHMLILGSLINLAGKYTIKSNLEAGHGRFDIAVSPNSSNYKRFRNYLFEFKKATSEKDLEESVSVGMKQLYDRKYEKYFDNDRPVVRISVSAYKKRIAVKVEELKSNTGPNSMKLFE